MTDTALGGSFRDPSGFVFVSGGVLYRQVNEFYRNHYDQLMAGGLYQALTAQGLLVSHEEVPPDEHSAPQPDIVYKLIRPELVRFISYPYEWCFSQLRDAALTTLQIQKIALEHGMSLKDCSAFNIQFHRGKPVFIDTLSFEPYREGEPWVAYRQFCQHFLGPLALMRYKDVRLSSLFRVFVDGPPLDITSMLLPWKTRLVFPLLSHIHLHAKSQERHADSAATSKRASRRKISKLAFRGLIDNLESAVKRLKWNPAGTEWGDYYDDTNYSDSAMEHKRKLVETYVGEVSPSTAWDLGANTGVFSRIASDAGAETIAADIDPAAVEKNYRRIRSENTERLLPMVIDLTNPSPGIGWNHDERSSLVERGPVDIVMALALIHHLAISNNLPFGKIARFLRRVGDHLIIEFVPKSDSQVQRLLTTREDIFADYHQEAFEAAFSSEFGIIRKDAVAGSERTMYLMKGRDE